MTPGTDTSKVFMDRTQIEIINEQIERGQIRFALFDFDGTLSLIRRGWQGVMIPMMVGILADLNSGESEETLTELVSEFVSRLTGKQTIYQMIELCEQISQRGGQPQEPLVYKHMYLDLLWEQIKQRVADLKSGAMHPDEALVPGSRAILENLTARGIQCYLASGTDQPFVLDEAAALQVTPFFEGRIYGALDDYKSFSKAQVIQRMIEQNGLKGHELVAFGDGYVEIEEAKRVGGITVGVASDETGGQALDAWKRNRLIQAGADLIVPHFGEQSALISYLLETR